MAVSVSNVLEVPYRIVGNQKEVCRDVTFDTEYTKEGEALTRAQLGLNNVERATVTVNAVGGSVNVASGSYDPKTEVIHLYDETPAEVEAGKDVSKVTARVIARGN